MFGTRPVIAGLKRRHSNDASVRTVLQVLNRNASIESLSELWRGLDDAENRPDPAEGAKLALAFDTNALFRLGIGSQGANALDFLTKRHTGPLILPGQVVQETWNNFLAGAEPRAKGVERKLRDLEAEIEALDQDVGEAGATAREALQALIDSHGDWTDGSAVNAIRKTVELLMRNAIVPYVPRAEFFELGRARKQSKTPPGFKDDQNNLGDFYVWADFLLGLAISNLDGVSMAILVTNDEKKDWSRARVAHPILVAEARAVAGIDFRLWTLDRFMTRVKALSS